MRFDPARFFAARLGGHHAALGIRFRDAGDGWIELDLPYDARLVGDERRGTLATGPIVAMMDVAASAAVWHRLGRFAPHATLDLRLDHLRSAVPGRTVVGRAACVRIDGRLAFVRGEAHDGDAADPIAQVAGTFMAPEGYR